jgi:NADH dehydrogenase
VLVGCSFAGLELLYRAARRRGRFAPHEMFVIEPREHHPYIPLVHEAASGVRAPEALLFDTPAFASALGAVWLGGAAVGLDLERRLVVLADGRDVAYDRLVLAIGSVPDIPGGYDSTPGIIPAKFVDDAIALRKRLHALRVAGSHVLRVVVVGAGITGVEWSAELASGRVDGARMAVTLIEANTRILPHFRPDVANRAARALRRSGVELLTGRRMRGIEQGRVLLEGGAGIPFDAVVWAGGMRPHPLVASLGLPTTSTGHVVVTPRLEVLGHEGIYAVGDCARVAHDGQELPTTERAIEAIWQGAYLARRFSAGWPRDSGPTYPTGRTFPYGLSLGPARSSIIFERLFVETRALVRFRRWLQWGYYARLRLVAWWRAKSRAV